MNARGFGNATNAMGRLGLFLIIPVLLLAIASASCAEGSEPAAPASRAPSQMQEAVVVEREVVKEVPVERVVEKSVVRAVPQSAAAPAPAAPAPAPTAAPAAQAQQQAGAYSQYGSRQARAGATTFRDYRQSLFVETTRDSISTFSLDTDRTSYHLALNWARSGYEVDPDSVRAEEWINAFNYGYKLPKHSDSFAVTADVFDHPIDGGLYMARLGFQAPHLQDDRPLNVTLVLDASGSMSDGNRVAIAREAAESIRRSLGRQDRIGVVHFHDRRDL